MYTITLENGSKIENLTLNGNNFISEDDILDSVFDNNLGTVVISDGESTETHNDMVLIQNTKFQNQSWFVLADKSEEQKAKEASDVSETDIQLALAELYELIENLGGTNG